MRGFTENPILVHLKVKTPDLKDLPDHLFDGRRAILKRDFHYYNDRTHTAHQGLITDGGSIPRFWWRTIGSPFTYYIHAFLIHDEYCQRARAIKEKRARKELRLKADLLLDEMLHWLGCGKIKRKLIYRAVRIGAAFDKGVKDSPETGIKHRFLPYAKKMKKNHFAY